MTINWFTNTIGKMSSRDSIESKRWGLASDMDYHYIKEVFRVMMLYFAQYDHCTPLAQLRLYRKVVSLDKLDRFLPTTEKFRKRYVTKEKGKDGGVVETPDKKFIECCAKCVKLFNRVLNKEIDEIKCVKELMGDSYKKCKEIREEANNRWFWESSIDTIVDTFSNSRVSYDEGVYLEDEIDKKRLELTDDLCESLSRLRAKQSIVWELHTPSESIVDTEYAWSDYVVHVESLFDASPPIGIRLIVTASLDGQKVSANVKVCLEEDHLLVTYFKMTPMTNDKDPKNHIAEGIVYKLLAEILVQRSPNCKYVLISDSYNIQAHDYIAHHYGLTSNDDFDMDRLGLYFAQHWTLTKDTALALVEKSPLFLGCGNLTNPEGMCVKVKIDSEKEPKFATLTLKKEGETIVINSMVVNPPIPETVSRDDQSANQGKRMEGVVYQFIAELLLQKLGGCTSALFPHKPEVHLHGEIAGEYGLIPPDQESDDEAIAWKMTYDIAKRLVGGRITVSSDSGTLQLL